jgi:hypothetical protein
MTIDGIFFRVEENGVLLGSEQSALELVGAGYGSGTEMMVIPVARFEAEFFRLGSGLAGAFIQKLQNYGYRLVVLGDISAQAARSEALAAFVRETNTRGHHLFVVDETELASRLKR